MLRIIELSVFVVENVGNNAIEIYNCINYRQLQMRITIVVEWYYRLNKKIANIVDFNCPLQKIFRCQQLIEIHGLVGANCDRRMEPNPGQNLNQ